MTRFLAFFICAICAVSAHAGRPALSFECLAQRADLVVLGRVSAISQAPVLHDAFGDVHVATVSVERSLKGSVEFAGEPSSTLELTLRPGISHQADLQQGDSYVLFIVNTEAGPHVLNGNQGALPVVDGHVLLHDGSRTTAKHFAESVRAALRRSCSGIAPAPK